MPLFHSHNTIVVSQASLYSAAGSARALILAELTWFTNTIELFALLYILRSVAEFSVSNLRSGLGVDHLCAACASKIITKL
jgi:hypothetical protein